MPDLTIGQKRWLCELMGVCCHEWEWIGVTIDEVHSVCQKCKEQYWLFGTPPNLDFTTWETFGRLWEIVTTAPWLEQFFHFCWSLSWPLDTKYEHFIEERYIHPLRFALALCQFGETHKELFPTSSSH